jgi:integrase/recombinase XerC
MKTSIKVLLKKDYLMKDNTVPVYLRIIIRCKPIYFSLNISVAPKNFKADGNSAIIAKADPDHKYKNMVIEKSYNRASAIRYNFEKDDKILTPATFKLQFKPNYLGSSSFYDFAEAKANQFTGKFSPATIKNYFDQIHKMKEFSPVLNFIDITPAFLTKYDIYLKKERANKRNTIIKSLKFVKNIVNKAISENIIKENPIEKHKLGEIKGHRIALTAAELKTLENIYDKGSLDKHRHNVLRYFLFGCYCGLRFQDMKRLKFSNIKNDFITVEMGKTKEIVEIPLISEAKKLIPLSGFDKQNVFRVLTGQPTNRYLKEIMIIAGINKHISFHCSRHTFATIAKSSGMEYDVISKILGHSDLKTTKIYAKYENDYMAKEMNNKWGKNQ